MAKVTIIINADSAAFEGNADQETARILQDLAEDILAGRIDNDGALLRDFNGNSVGRIEIEEDEEE